MTRNPPVARTLASLALVLCVWLALPGVAHADEVGLSVPPAVHPESPDLREFPVRWVAAARVLCQEQRRSGWPAYHRCIEVMVRDQAAIAAVWQPLPDTTLAQHGSATD